MRLGIKALVFRWLVVIAGSSLAFGTASAQTVVGADAHHPSTAVKDSSMLKPPAGAKIAVVEWTDMECPACASAFPFVHAAADHAKIPIVHYDFLIPGHPWSPQAAIFARYLQIKVSPAVATDYRRQVFATQQRIASPDDLQRFTERFMAAQHKSMPFVVDPGDAFRKAIDADCALGRQMGLAHTPSIFVVTKDHWTEVADAVQIDTVIAQAEAESAPKKAVVKGAGYTKGGNGQK